MDVINDTGWIDGKDLDAAHAVLMLRVFADSHRKRGRCVVCRADQPKRAQWPTYAMEVTSKVTHQNTGDITYVSCPSCEAALDKFLFALETKH